MNKNFEIGQNVVRKDGGYTVGRTGNIIEIDNVKMRARVFWTYEGLRTWVSFKSIELTSIPYRIEPGYMAKPGKWVSSKYVAL